MKVFLPALLTVFLSNPLMADVLWAEGNCNGSRVNEGATRDLYNRAVGYQWQNQLGDWLDKDLTKQGTKAYSTVEISNRDFYQTLTLDTTEIVKKWHG